MKDTHNVIKCLKIFSNIKAQGLRDDQKLNKNQYLNLLKEVKLNNSKFQIL